MITVGHDADFVIWDPQREFVVNAADLRHRHKLTPYHGQSLNGVVRQTYLRGKKIYDRGKLDPQARGVMLL